MTTGLKVAHNKRLFLFIIHQVSMVWVIIRYAFNIFLIKRAKKKYLNFYVMRLRIKFENPRNSTVPMFILICAYCIINDKRRLKIIFRSQNENIR